MVQDFWPILSILSKPRFPKTSSCNVEKNVEDLLLVEDIVLVSVKQVKVDAESHDQGVAGEDYQVEQRERTRVFLNSLNFLGFLHLLILILLLPADVLHHEDGGEGGEDPARELVVLAGDVDHTEHEDSM